MQRSDQLQGGTKRRSRLDKEIGEVSGRVHDAQGTVGIGRLLLERSLETPQPASLNNGRGEPGCMRLKIVVRGGANAGLDAVIPNLPQLVTECKVLARNVKRFKLRQARSFTSAVSQVEVLNWRDSEAERSWV